MRNHRVRGHLVRRVWASAFAPMLLGACSFATPAFTSPTPAEMTALSERVAIDPTDMAAVAGLASGYVVDGQLDEAQSVLADGERAVGADPTLLLLRGFVHEAAGNWTAARDDYMEYLAQYPGRRMTSDTRTRLDAVAAMARRIDAADLVADETFSEPPEQGRTIVLPLAHDSSDPETDGLAVAFSDMLARDLSRLGSPVDGGAFVRAVVDAAVGSPDERDDMSLGVRVAGLLGAERTVLGRLRTVDDGRVRLDLTLLTIRESGRLSISTMSAEDSQGTLLDLERQLMFALSAAAERTVSPFAAASANRRELYDVNVLTAFGIGLIQEERGEHDAALTTFSRARALDPTFEPAVNRALRAAAITEVTTKPVRPVVEEIVRAGEREYAVQSHVRGATTRRQRILAGLGAHERSVLAERLGLDRIGIGVLLEIVVTPPPGLTP